MNRSNLCSFILPIISTEPFFFFLIALIKLLSIKFSILFSSLKQKGFRSKTLT
uniref:Uncharacterized protein n=1 Tax=Rhizophora mucronata TaxID=61149 RepID=A0A2P2P3H0_RHIMU